MKEPVAPVHKASPQFGSAAGKIETPSNFDASMELVDSVHKVSEPVLRGKVGGGNRQLIEQCGFCGSAPGVPCFEVEFESSADTPAVEPPPARVWITWDDRYPWDTPEMGGDEYVHADIIRKAVIACAPHLSRYEGEGFVAVRRADYEALVALIKEGK